MPVTNAERELIRLIRQTQFGCISNIKLSAGQPVFDGNTSVSVEFKLSGLEPTKEVLSEQDYLKKPQVRTLFERFRTLGNGTVECLDVRDGLPFKITIKRKALI
jgi:hypothetical protein